MLYKNQYIYKTENGYKFRLRIPTELKVFFNSKSEITKIIKVRNLKEALKVARFYLSEYDKLCVSLKMSISTY